MRSIRAGRTFWCPSLVDFPALFAEQSRSTADPYPPGFPDGSCLLITGPPGAGKTTLALAIIRDLMWHQPDASLIILSNEITRPKLQSDFAEFGWFQAFDAVFTDSRCRHAPLPNSPTSHSNTRAKAVEIAEAIAGTLPTPILFT